MIEIIVGLLCFAHAVTWYRLMETRKGLVLTLKGMQAMVDVIELQQKLRLLDKLGQDANDVEAEFQRIIKDFKP